MEPWNRTTWSGCVVLLLLAGTPTGLEAARRPPPQLTGQLDLTEAGPEQLQLLPGIGPARAQAILALRAKQPFRAVGDLRRIKGIGPKTLQRLKPFLRIGGGTTLSRVPPTSPTPPTPPMLLAARPTPPGAGFTPGMSPLRAASERFTVGADPSDAIPRHARPTAPRTSETLHAPQPRPTPNGAPPLPRPAPVGPRPPGRPLRLPFPLP